MSDDDDDAQFGEFAGTVATLHVVASHRVASRRLLLVRLPAGFRHRTGMIIDA